MDILAYVYVIVGMLLFLALGYFRGKHDQKREMLTHRGSFIMEDPETEGGEVRVLMDFSKISTDDMYKLKNGEYICLKIDNRLTKKYS